MLVNAENSVLFSRPEGTEIWHTEYGIGNMEKIYSEFSDNYLRLTVIRKSYSVPSKHEEAYLVICLVIGGKHED